MPRFRYTKGRSSQNPLEEPFTSQQMLSNENRPLTVPQNTVNSVFRCLPCLELIVEKPLAAVTLPLLQNDFVAKLYIWRFYPLPNFLEN